MNTDIHHHNNITAKSWILFAMKIFFETQIMTKTRALIYHGLYSSVAERIKHEASDMLTHREKSSNPVRSRFFISR